MTMATLAAVLLGFVFGAACALGVKKLAERKSLKKFRASINTKSDIAASNLECSWAENLPMAVFTMNREGKLIFANATCRKVFSSVRLVDLENLKLGRAPHWVHPNDGRNVVEFFGAIRGLKRGTLETRVRVSGENGDWLWLQLKLTSISRDLPIQSEGQSELSSDEVTILGTCEDVTLFQTVIQALRDREARTKRLLSGVKDAAIFILCEDGYIQFCNEAIEPLLGYAETELKGQHISILSPRAELLSGHILNSLSQADQTLHHEEVTRKIRKSGTGFWANVLITSLPAEAPYSKNYCVVLRDVSNYKREEKELHEWKKRFEQLSENVKEAFWIYDVRAAELVYVSPVFKALIGIDPNTSETFFSDILRKVHPSDLTLARTFMSDLTIGHDSTVELRAMGPNGQLQWLKFKSFAVRDSSNRVHRIVGVSEDITESKTAQIALKKAKEEADAANNAKSEFLANMSHEIRTPLGAIMGFAELIGDFQNSEEERNSALKAILRNGRQLGKIIDEILDLSKVEAGKLELEEEEIELLGFVEDVTTLLGLQAREKAVAMNLEPIGLLPKTIRTDGTKFRQILINIIGNAVKFTTRGSVTICVSTELDAETSKLKLTITDTGPGLDQAQQSRLFHPFVQGDSSTRRRFGGTGLGLVLSRRLARLLGGDLQLLSSTPDVGSSFEISLNIGPAARLKLEDTFDGQRKKQADSLQNQKTPRLDGKKILVVDDAPDNRLIVQRFLTHAGASVDHAENGMSGAKMALEKEYDLIVMDIQMPEFDGYQTITFLRQHGFTRPVIALSAHAMREDRERSLASGFNEHMSKPVNRQELMTRIAFLLNAF